MIVEEKFMEGRGSGGRGGDLSIDIVPWDPVFEPDVIEICWRTGFMGESLEGLGRFEDRRLFAMIFALPYFHFDPGVCFLAVPKEMAEGADPGARGGTTRRRAVGYITGTSDTAAQRRDFARRWRPRIAARIAFYDWWRHPGSARQALAFARAEAGQEDERQSTQAPILGGPEYPAQLHINILPGWQGHGVGSRLMAAHLDALRARGAPGVFLQTSDRNRKALPFYEKLGFRLVNRSRGEFWTGSAADGLDYVMRLDGPKEGAGRGKSLS
jgi:GNAT superfamily N-acetyltransferase